MPPQNVELASIVEFYLSNLRGSDLVEDISRRLGAAIKAARQDRVEQLLKLHAGLQVGPVQILNSEGRTVSLLGSCIPGADVLGDDDEDEDEHPVNYEARAERLQKRADMVHSLVKAGEKATAEDIYYACVPLERIAEDSEDLAVWRDAVEAMLTSGGGVTPDFFGPDGRTALSHAMKHVGPMFCMRFINAGAPLNSDVAQSLLDLALACGRDGWAGTFVDVIKTMIDKGAKLLPGEDSLNKRLAAAVMMSATSRIVRLLLAAGADPCNTDGGLLDDHDQPLSALAFVLNRPAKHQVHAYSRYIGYGHLEQASAAAAGAAVAMVTAAPANGMQDWYVYHAASRLGGAQAEQWREVLKILLEKGLSANASSNGVIPSDLHDTALGVAIHTKDAQTVKLLLEYGASVNRHVSGRSYLGLLLDNRQVDLAADLLLPLLPRRTCTSGWPWP